MQHLWGKFVPRIAADNRISLTEHSGLTQRVDWLPGKTARVPGSQLSPAARFRIFAALDDQSTAQPRLCASAVSLSVLAYRRKGQ